MDSGIKEKDGAAFSRKKATFTEVTVTMPCKGRNLFDMGQKAFGLVTDVTRYPEYMPSINALTILEKKEDHMVTSWDARIDGAPIQWIQDLWPKEADLEMDFEAIEGDFDTFKGKWRVETVGDDLHLHLFVEYHLGIPVIGEVLGPILKEKVEANCLSMLQAIAGQLA